MKLDTESTSFYLAYAFAYFLSALVIKLIGYWHSDILLAACLGLTHSLLWDSRSRYLREAALLALFFTFDRSLLNVGNGQLATRPDSYHPGKAYFLGSASVDIYRVEVFPVIGIGCVREKLHKDLVLKECVTFACALILLSTGRWYDLGRILIVNFLLLFYFFTIGSAIVILYVKLLCALFKLTWRTFLTGDAASVVDVDAK